MMYFWLHSLTGDDENYCKVINIKGESCRLEKPRAALPRRSLGQANPIS